MRKTEFLKEMSNKLRERMTKAEIDEQIRYYSDYIASETAKGKSEEEVIAQLGDPILLARTIMSTKGTTYHTTENSVTETEKKDLKDNRSSCLVMVIIAIIAASFLFWLVGSIFRILAPILVPVLVVGAIMILKQKK